ncbi:bifunctional 2-methylcitrate synthase/citrate synthase [Schumannella sp. 10F1B-5-1]|uniref:bifunctional 2-methylcitrate synthase/citrate synthase n=1 Tax=Schumannella sp. 10F1B-5-1 TaxID=2590780 RepID=UPI001131956B|nr:bifunctional 2-methylcitrate synthase/citrate synthase [Schumannella sp. 10F1B-5-1]TPW71572.1 bifunctional 2-methylcitrate synthase/citrate synthase [Schumannella sp. 10F1B-5-1]
MTDIKKGLAGVVVDTTAISKVNPDTNSLLYRGYPVQELAAALSYEEVAWLLWHGELPSDAELAAFVDRERAGRALADNVKAAIDLTPLSAHPMDVVRTAVSVIGANDAEAHDSSPEANLAKAERLFAAIPAVVAYDQRRRRGEDIVPPRDDLDYSRNFLWMTFGEEPSDTAADVFRISMVLYAEHSFNASTFTARVVTSTLADLHSAVVAAIGALKGPLHGGANEAVMDVFDEIGDADGAGAWLESALAEKRKIMGFGHRVYKNGDSRVPTMQAAFERLVAEQGGSADALLALYHRLADAMDAAKSIKPNLDYPSGPAYHLLGFDTTTFTPLFVAARVVGWTAHVMEQLEANALIRPLSEYVGPDERHLED